MEVDPDKLGPPPNNSASDAAVLKALNPGSKIEEFTDKENDDSPPSQETSTTRSKRTRKVPTKYTEFEVKNAKKSKMCKKKSSNESAGSNVKNECAKGNTDGNEQPILNDSSNKDDGEDILSCDKCERLFKSEKSLSVHKKSNCQSKHVCETCGKEFNKKKNLRLHQIRENGIKKYKCPHCDYSGVTKQDLDIHLPRHDELAKYICHICGQRVLSKKRLSDHINFIHLQEEKYNCELCSFTTFNRGSLRRHVIVRHTDSERYKCPICNAVIKQSGTFKVHMRIHLGEKPYPCTECSKSFRSSSQLAAHRKIHGTRDFMCDVCTRTFKTRHHLRRHQIIHTDSKPFQCKICMYSCNVKDNLNKHIRSIHKVYDSKSSLPNEKLHEKVDKETPEAKLGSKVAGELVKAFSKKMDKEVTLDTLREKEIENEKMRLEQIQIAKKLPKKSSNAVVTKKRSNQVNEDVEQAAIVIKSDRKDFSEIVAVDQVTGTMITLSPTSEPANNCVLDISSLLPGTVIQFDELSGRILQIDNGTTQLNAIDTVDDESQIILTDENLLNLKSDDKCIKDKEVELDAPNVFTVSTLNCDTLNENCDNITITDCQSTLTEKKEAPQIVLLVSEPDLAI